METMYERPRVSVKIEGSSTLTFPRGLPYIVSILFTEVNFTCVRVEKLRNSGNQPLAAPMYVRSWKKKFAQKTIKSITHGTKSY